MYIHTCILLADNYIHVHVHVYTCICTCRCTCTCICRCIFYNRHTLLWSYNVKFYNRLHNVYVLDITSGVLTIVQLLSAAAQ